MGWNDKDYCVTLMLGYSVRPFDLELLYTQDIPESAHYEDRYDPRTGQKVSPVRIIDTPASCHCILDGEDLGDNFPGLLQALSQKMGCDYDTEEDAFEGTCEWVVFGVKVPTEIVEASEHLTISDDISLEELKALFPRVEALAQKLLERRIPFRGPSLIAVPSIS